MEETTPVSSIKNFLDSAKAALHVLNISAHPDEAEASNKKHVLENLLQGCNTEYHFVTNADFNDAVDRFVAENQMDLVIMASKKQGIFESIFTTHHTKKLAFHSKFPLMAANK